MRLMYTTTSEIIARLGVLEQQAKALLDEISLMQNDLIDNGQIIYEEARERNGNEERTQDELDERDSGTEE